MALLIIEDEKVLLEKYQNYASDLFDDILVASSLEEASSLWENNEISCILSDNVLPDGKGIDFISSIRKKFSDLPIVMITAYADKDLAINSINSNVTLFIEKPAARDQIIEALGKCKDLIDRNQKFITLSDKFEISKNAKFLLSDEHDISNRELEVIQLLLHHQNNKVIAAKLFISPGTVKNHLSNIFQKLQTSSKEEVKVLIQKLNKV